FFYEDGFKNLYDEHSEKVYYPIEDVSTEISYPNVILGKKTIKQSYPSAKSPKKKNRLL
ncbi:uncharacterized protein BX663DRAFT_428436, partial [Cokeromyces recurvatus]|uniref:uncharacterized protein n=1 Tax=Cokeromyces recurvatus TaxID=90255 RepID=UPI00221E8795